MLKHESINKLNLKFPPIKLLLNQSNFLNQYVSVVNGEGEVKHPTQPF